MHPTLRIPLANGRLFASSFRRCARRLFPLLGLAALMMPAHGAGASDVLFETKFSDVKAGEIPPGWRDLIDYRPSRNWAVDGKGFLRVMMKEYLGNPVDGERKRRADYLAKYGLKYLSGVLAYEGLLADGSKAGALASASASARFKKTSDDDVFLGVVLRLQDRDNYYEARFLAADRVKIIKVSAGTESELASLVTRTRIAPDAVWELEFRADGDLLSVFVRDDKGEEQARVYAGDPDFSAGFAGLKATTFASARAFSIRALQPVAVKFTQAQIAAENAKAAASQPSYPVVQAILKDDAVTTPFENVGPDYDVIVAGAGTGGIGAALQAARMGSRVLLLEETDLLGGQMANAAVTSMDDGGIWAKNPVRERGIYREFHESAVNHYYTIEKDPYTAYHFNLQSEGGYEPHVARGVLYGLIAETRARKAPDGNKTVLDFAVRTKVSGVKKDGDTVTGATLEEWTPAGPKTKSVTCRVLIDATEYGDVIPLTGARYRVGTSTSDRIDPATRAQDHTWLGVIKEYPAGIPEELRIKEAPPGYEDLVKRFKNYQLYGTAAWGGENRGMKGPRLWWVYASWRGMPDSTSPATGEMTEERHAKCGLNGGNDYPVSAATMEDPAQRAKDELYGINRTLCIVYWFQNEMGLPWGVADDEGYYSPYNLQRMKDRGVRADLLPIAARFPQWPYVRESRRIIGVETLRGEDLYTRDRGDEAAKHWASTVAINDYSFDLHGTEDSLEEGLDEHDYINATGPFPIPFGVFIPEKIDGFVPAEKNFSQSRLANGATRLQPSTMVDGQAAGAIAAMAVRQKVQPRALNIIDVQSALLDSGDTLMSRWYEDVPYGTPLWRATQLLALYGMMDRPGPMPKEGVLGEGVKWGAEELISERDAALTMKQLTKVVPDKSAIPAGLAKSAPTRAAFALAVADVLRKHGKYLVTAAPPYAPPHDFAKARKAADKSAEKKKQKPEPE